MLIPMFIIIGVWGGQRRVYATVKFFLYTFLGSLLMLVALIYMYTKTGDYSIAAFQKLPLTMNEQVLIFFAFLLAFAVEVCRCGRFTRGCLMRTSRRPPAVP